MEEHDRIAARLEEFEKTLPSAGSIERLEQLDEMIDIYEQIPREEQNLAQKTRCIFLKILQDSPVEEMSDRILRFVVQEVEPVELRALEWDSPHKIVSFCEILYSATVDDTSIEAQVRRQVRELLSHALRRYEEQRRYEQMFQVLQLAPIASTSDDPELRRLRNQAYLYEMRKVYRRRKILYAYLALQAVLITLVFPVLFINAENGFIQRQVENAADLDLPLEAAQYLSFGDGLYWALITAGSIGYGDITPVTNLGKVLAATLGIMGVITVGIVAGLVIQWITPRNSI